MCQEWYQGPEHSIQHVIERFLHSYCDENIVVQCQSRTNKGGQKCFFHALLTSQSFLRKLYANDPI